MTKSTITRERIQRIIRAIDSESYDEEEIREWLSSDEIMELSRMALAAMDSEPVAWMHNNNNIGIPAITTSQKIGKYWISEFKDVQPLYRHAQPAPVVPNGLRLALSNAGIAAPESDEMLAATCEKHIQALVTWVRDRKPFQSAPVVPEEANPDSIEILASARRRDHAVFQWDEDQRNAAADSWNACRAAMLAAAPQEVKGD